MYYLFGGFFEVPFPLKPCRGEKVANRPVEGALASLIRIRLLTKFIVPLPSLSCLNVFQLPVASSPHCCSNVPPVIAV